LIQCVWFTQLNLNSFSIARLIPLRVRWKHFRGAQAASLHFAAACRERFSGTGTFADSGEEQQQVAGQGCPAEQASSLCSPEQNQLPEYFDMVFAPPAMLIETFLWIENHYSHNLRRYFRSPRNGRRNKSSGFCAKESRSPRRN
jgi:hypothetical protein